MYFIYEENKQGKNDWECYSLFNFDLWEYLQAMFFF